LLNSLRAKYGLNGNQLQELMSEVFILGYLRSQGGFRSLSEDEISSFCGKKLISGKARGSMEIQRLYD
jgi:hypothetical protein